MNKQLNRLFSILTVFALTFSMFLPITLKAQNRQLTRPSNDKTAQKRIALVIGNGAYQKAKPLPNPANDAADMAQTLKDLGFEVLSGANQNKRQMETLIREFGAKLANGGTGLFYYAGHGIQVGGENYLVPVDADIPDEDEVSYSAVPISLVLTKMTTAKNDLNIVILDACRNNPFARSWRTFRDGATNDGLAKITPPTGTLVLYATEPGKVASDGDGRNGLFTEALLKQMKKPNVEYDQMVKAVSTDVWQKSKKQQLPWKEGNSLQDFYFVKTETNTPNTTKPITPTKDESVTEKDKSAVEREAWDLIKNSPDTADFRSFLEEFPNGANTDNAKIKLEQIIWDAVKESKDKAKIQTYLNEFPTGANAPLARIKLRQLETPTTPTTTETNTTAVKTAGAISKSKLPNNVGMSFAYIPAGDFMMGGDKGMDEKPVHKVTISQGFWMGQTEVTQAQWKAVMGALPSKCDYGKLEGEFLGDNKPIICVNWDDVQEFVRIMNSKNDGYKYRLPTEAEWEYAARAGTTGDYAGYLDSMAWYANNSGRTIIDADAIWKKDSKNYGKRLSENGNSTHDVGTKQANAWNLYDMHGNVWEWCQDWYSENYYASSPTVNPTGATSGSLRVYRGGSWNDDAVLLRSAFRYRNSPSFRYSFLGFRVVRY